MRAWFDELVDVHREAIDMMRADDSLAWRALIALVVAFMDTAIVVLLAVSAVFVVVGGFKAFGG